MEPTWDVAIGIDWADQKHDYALEDGTLGEFANTAQAIADFVKQMRAKFPGKRIAICLEQTHGSLIYALLEYEDLLLYPINPAQLASFRRTLHPSGKIDDQSDAVLLMQLLKLHSSRLRPWRPDSCEMRALGSLVEHRRTFVNDRTKVLLKFQAALKKYYPEALQMASNHKSALLLDLLIKWPTLQKLKRQKPSYLRIFFRQHGCRNDTRIDQRIELIRSAKPLVTDMGIIEPLSDLVVHLAKQIRLLNQTIEAYDLKIAKLGEKVSDVALFSKIRGVGEQLGPRLAAAFGSDRDRYDNASQFQAYSGIAPVMRKSGKKSHVSRRHACPNFLRQTFHEFADSIRKFSPWSRAYYQTMRAKGNGHHAAVRSLAYKWIRILYVVWKTQTEYSEETYIQQLKRRKSPLYDTLQKTTTSG